MKKTKAETLLFLSDKLKSARILNLAYFSVKEWQQNQNSVLQKIKNKFPITTKLIIRSSSFNEDSLTQSNAGKYKSILNVEFNNLVSSINSVIDSFGPHALPEDQVLVQNMLEDVIISGVLFTYDPTTQAPYYVINYEHSSDTTSVTSGVGKNLETQIIPKTCELSKLKNSIFFDLVVLAQELENILKIDNLDIEFAISKDNNLFLLQARPLVLKKIREKEEFSQKEVLLAIERKIRQHSLPHPFLHGKKTVFGIMPDWNPAEIIGTRPKELALSLYKELITDSIWAYQRDNYGYKNLRSFPLLVDFFGLPYIDVRVSFNSFIPKDIPDSLSDKLTSYYIERLIENPHLHDKVEFEIVFSCFTFNLNKQLEKLKKYSFSNDECKIIQNSLKTLTNKIIHIQDGLWIKDSKKISKLKKHHESIFSNFEFDEITKIYWLIEDCKRNGTLPFAGLARAGFIAVQILNSMVSENILSQLQRDQFIASLATISSQMKYDFSAFSKQEFLKKYGHLRPGTYDLLMPRYDEAPDLYFNWENRIPFKNAKEIEFNISIEQVKRIEYLLKENNIEHTAVDLFTFLKSAIEGRELAKFEFTKNLSDVLGLIRRFGEKYGFSADDMAFVSIQDILSLYGSCLNAKKVIADSISKGREKYAITSKLILPHLIQNEADIWSFSVQENKTK